MNNAEAVAISPAVGLTAGAVVWEWLRGDLMPRLRNSRNEERLRELAERLACLEGQLAAT
jgi:hypothetical protein